MKLTDLEIPIEVLAKRGNLILTDVAPFFHYVDGKKSENIAGYRYTVVAENNGYEKFSVKITGTTPAITPEQLTSMTKKVFAEFQNGIAKVYRTNTGEMELSVSATSVDLVPEE